MSKTIDDSPEMLARARDPIAEAVRAVAAEEFSLAARAASEQHSRDLTRSHAGDRDRPAHLLVIDALSQVLATYITWAKDPRDVLDGHVTDYAPGRVPEAVDADRAVELARATAERLDRRLRGISRKHTEARTRKDGTVGTWETLVVVPPPDAEHE